MTTPIERVFLFGEDHPGFDLIGIPRLIVYGDLTSGSCIIFAALVLAGMTIDNWKVLAPWISLAVSALVVSPIKVLVSGAISLVRAIAAASSVGELKTSLLVKMHRVLQPIVVWLLGCLAPLNWFFPNNGGLMCFRLSCTSFFSIIAHKWFLAPASQYLYGASAGLMSTTMERTLFCLEVLEKSKAVWRPTHRQSMDGIYCIGEEAGLQFQSIIEDDWELPRRFDELVNSEIRPLHAFAFVAICALLFLVAASASDILAMATSLLKSVLVRVVDASTKAQLQGIPLTLRESHLWDMINRYEVDLAKLREILNVKTEELRMAKRTRDDGWGEAQQLAARRREADEARSREHNDNVGLREQVRGLTRQLVAAQGRQDYAVARERALIDKNARLHEQLADRAEQAFNSLDDTDSLRAELRARNEQLATIEQRLAAAADAREEQSRGRQQLAAEHQQLTVLHGEQTAQVNRLRAEYEALKVSYDELFSSQSDDAVAGLEIKLETAQANFAELEARHAAMIKTAEGYYQETQASQARAMEREVALQQGMEESMRILRSDCDLILAQERQASQEAGQTASRLAAEVTDLQEDDRCPGAPPCQ